MSQPLPSKEANLFKAVLKFYEGKQYKKALKTTETILKKFPDHGETLCMKGLVLSYVGRKEEAYEFAHLGLKKDIKSHMCWHIFGLLYRADRNYEEAIKCYRNALRIDKDNFQILKDLALLEIQTRNLDGFIETRQQLLSSKSSQKASWIGLVTAYHFARNFDMAIKVMDMYESTQPPHDPDVYDFENSEIIMYKVMLYEESGRWQEGLDFLLNNQQFIFDNRAWKEARVNFLLHLGRLTEAADFQRELLDSNPENSRYYTQLERCKGLMQENTEGRITMLKELADAYPKANTPRRLLLELFTGEELQRHVDTYLRAWLSKGVPSLFVIIKPLYKRPGVSAMIHGLVTNYLKNLRGQPSRLGAQDDETQTPTTLLWTLYFAAQHYAHLGQFGDAIAMIDQAIDHTPTVVEIVQGKAKILKMAGDIAKASEVSNEARLLDLQDRFINSKATKYMLRNDQAALAEETIGLFAKGDSINQTNNLTEMQCMWFALEAGCSYQRQNAYGKALKKFHEVQKHFHDIQDDQLDFHGYCLRKMTLRAYIRLVRVEDNLYSHRFYLEAAKHAIEIYIHLHDKPKTTVVGGQEIDLESLSEADRKKALNKLKKQEAIAKASKGTDAGKKTPDAQATDSKSSAAANTATAGAQGKKKDDDPDGLKLLETNDPLGEAIKFLQPLLHQYGHHIDTHLLAIDIYLRKGKLLHVLRSIKKALAIDPNHPILHKGIVRYHLALNAKTDLNDVVKTVLTEETGKMLKDLTLAQFTAEFLHHNRLSVPHVTAAAESMVLASPGAKTEAVKTIMSLQLDQVASFTLKHAIHAHRILVNWDSASAEQFKTKCQARFPLATYFALAAGGTALPS